MIYIICRAHTHALNEAERDSLFPFLPSQFHVHSLLVQHKRNSKWGMIYGMIIHLNRATRRLTNRRDRTEVASINFISAFLHLHVTVLPPLSVVLGSVSKKSSPRSSCERACSDSRSLLATQP
jgi:hypothetical protein